MIRDDEYLETKVMSATPEQLHLLVVDAAIKHTQLAIEALKEKNYEQSFHELNQARDFVGEIISGMKKEDQASELIEQLKALFAFVYKRLVEADMERNVTYAEEAVKILLHHRETWNLLCEKIRDQKIESGDSPQMPPGYEYNGPHNWAG